jgi:NAD(P)-dependent dehydrogenase (short-subunit alcohol dehydrogenase family)
MRREKTMERKAVYVILGGTGGIGSAVARKLAENGAEAAKAGVIGLGRSAAATCAPKGIRGNILAPGLLDTPLASGITGNPLMLKASEAMHSLPRIGRPEEVASVIVWLLSTESSWVTGQVIGFDGGLASVRARATA